MEVPACPAKPGYVTHRAKSWKNISLPTSYLPKLPE